MESFVAPSDEVKRISLPVDRGAVCRLASVILISTGKLVRTRSNFCIVNGYRLTV